MPLPASLGENEDLVAHILIHLPAKDLRRFISVSKLWRSAVSNPDFRTAHAFRHHNPTPSALLLSPTFSLPPTFKTVSVNAAAPKFTLHALDYLGEPFVKIWQSCNGLLLCSSTAAAVHDGFDRGLRWEGVRLQISGVNSIRYHVCNPTTMSFRTLDFPNFGSKGFVHALNLAFNPSISPHYKVVCIRRLDLKAESAYETEMGISRANENLNSIESSRVLVHEPMYEIYVFFSETRAWKPICSCKAFPNIYFRFPVFFNGAIHWNRHGPTSLLFDLGDECLRTMPIPVQFPMSETRFFGECGGRLCMIKLYLPTALEFTIFEMHDNHFGWEMAYHVDLNRLNLSLWDLGLNFNLTGRCNAFSVFDLIQTEKEEESRLVVSMCGRVFAYYLKNRTVVNLGTLELPSRKDSEEVALATLYYTGFCAFRFIATLACV